MMAAAEPSRLPSRAIIAIGRGLVAIGLLAAWQFAADYLGPLLMAQPGAVFQRLVTIATNGVLLQHTWSTLRLALSGFATAALAGILIPVALAFWPRLREAVEPFVRGAMGLPPFAIAPLLVLWLGIGEAPKFTIVFAVVFFLMYVACDSGLRNVDRRLIAMARVAGASGFDVAREIMLRSTLPFVLVGMKVALPRAVGAAIVGEMIVAEQGLGYYITHAREMADQTGTFAGIVAVSALVLFINAGLRRIETAALAGRPPGAEANG